MFHTANAWEEGDEVRLYGCCMNVVRTCAAQARRHMPLSRPATSCAVLGLVCLKSFPPPRGLRAPEVMNTAQPPLDRPSKSMGASIQSQWDPAHGTAKLRYLRFGWRCFTVYPSRTDG